MAYKIRQQVETNLCNRYGTVSVARIGRYYYLCLEDDSTDDDLLKREKISEALYYQIKLELGVTDK